MSRQSGVSRARWPRGGGYFAFLRSRFYRAPLILWAIPAYFLLHSTVGYAVHHRVSSFVVALGTATFVAAMCSNALPPRLRLRKDVLSKLEEGGENARAVELAIYRDGFRVGFDEGVVEIRAGALVFTGNQCSFVLSASDVKRQESTSGPVSDIYLYRLLLHPAGQTTSIGFRPGSVSGYRQEEQYRFGRAFNTWLTSPDEAATQSIYPPADPMPELQYTVYNIELLAVMSVVAALCSLWSFHIRPVSVDSVMFPISNFVVFTGLTVWLLYEAVRRQRFLRAAVD